MNNIIAATQKLGDDLIDSIAKEFIAQGHSLTGKTVESLRNVIRQTQSSLHLVIYMDNAGAYIDRGRRPGEKKVPIDALVRWIRARGISSPDKSIRQLAFAIQNSIFTNGSPTPDSHRYSKTGKRKNFVHEALTKREPQFGAIMAKAAEKDTDKELSAYVKIANRP